MPLIFGADGAQIDSQLLALLVEVAAFEAQRFRSVGHVMVMPLEFRQQGFALKNLHAARQRPGRKFGQSAAAGRMPCG